MAVEGETMTSKGEEVNDAAYGDFAHWASTNEGNPEKASFPPNVNALE